MNSHLREHARQIFDAALEAVRPEHLIAQAIRQNHSLHEFISKSRHILVVGGGKAGAKMVLGLEESLVGHIDRIHGIVNVPDWPTPMPQKVRLNSVRPAGVNQSTSAAVAGTKEILHLIESAQIDDIVIALISGGGSALLCAPADGITLEEKILTTQLMSDAGAPIRDINCVRKHLSQIKGGQLASRCRTNSIWALVISDVVGDPLDVIASGPTVADPTTMAGALAIIERHQLLDRVPSAVRRHLEVSTLETPKWLPENVHNLMIGNNSMALLAARKHAEDLGYAVQDFGDCIAGETCDVAAELADVVLTIKNGNGQVQPPCCLLIGGETTVSLPLDHGVGGRNQEFVLAMGCSLGDDGLRNVTVLSGGTDGEDGPTDAAGAILDRAHWQAAKSACLDAFQHLKAHDAYSFFDSLGGLLRTGLTGTNVMDIRVILIDK